MCVVGSFFDRGVMMSFPDSTVSMASNGLIPVPIIEFLRADNTDGDRNANGDHSDVNMDYFFEATEGHARIHRLIVFIGDTGVVGAEKYGALMRLTNGITIEHRRSDVVIRDLLDGVPVKQNMDWQKYSYDVVILDKGVAGPAGFVCCRWTFAKSGYPIRLIKNDRFCVTIRDDLSGLTDHYFSLQGYYEGSQY